MKEHTQIIFVGEPSTSKTKLENMVERRQHLCLADKMRLMSKSLRNCTEKKCIGQFHDPRNNSFCAYGALGFMAGIPKGDLVKQDFDQVLKSYGMDLDDQTKAVKMPDMVDYPERTTSLYQAIYQMNDHGASWNEIADHLDTWADNLQS